MNHIGDIVVSGNCIMLTRKMLMANIIATSIYLAASGSSSGQFWIAIGEISALLTLRLPQSACPSAQVELRQNLSLFWSALLDESLV
jgi:hypothetical protein